MAPTKRTAFLTDDFIRGFQPPTDKQVIIWDAPDAGLTGSAGIYVPGLGIRCTAKGVKAFVMDYRVEGVQRRPKIGRWPRWNTDRARRQAIEWRIRIDKGGDPRGERLTKREAATEQRKRDAAEMTVRQLGELFVKDYVSTKKPRTQEGYVGQLRCHVLPSKIADMRISEVTDTEITALHREISRTAKVQANRTIAMLSKMFNWAKKAKLCQSGFNNPASGIERTKEFAKERYPTDKELGAIKAALAAHPNQQHADAIRLLIFTGCRRNEALTMQWDHLALGKPPVWTRPAHLQKANKPHSVPLAPPAAEILRGIRNQQVVDGTYKDDGFVFPSSTSASGHLTRVRRTWAQVLKQAGIKGAMRLHDLRHGFASTLISAGIPIAVVGELMAHASPTTTRRYAHVHNKVAQDAVAKVADIFNAIEAPKIASVDQFPTQRRGAK
jgi:integrase